MTAFAHTFVGREAELGRLDALLAETLAGRGRVAFIAGEPGAGKTSLVAAFAARAEAAHPDLLYAYADCDARTGAGDAYLPFREILALLAGETEADVAQGNISEETASRLQRFLSASGEMAFEAGTEVLGAFLPGAGILAKIATRIARGGEPAPPKKLAPAQIQEQYTRIIQTAATRYPLVLVVDDLQWADAASLDLFFHLARRLEGSASLLVGAYRPNDVAMGRDGERHPLEPVLAELRRYQGDIVLDLDAADTQAGRAFVTRLLESRPNSFDDRFVDRLAHHTRGHALFVVEVLAALEQRGELRRGEDGRWHQAGEIDWSRIPPRVEGVIEERVGRLDPGLRGELEVASVEGEEFTAEAVAGVRRVELRDLIRRLGSEADRRHRLVAAIGVRPLGAARLSAYRFRHALFQRYLYGSIDPVQRAHLHQDVGEALERLLGDAADDSALRLADHFVEAGDLDRSVRYLLAAGRRAMSLSASAEALGLYQKALGIVATLPASEDRDRRELDVRVEMGDPLVALKGYADSGVQEHFDRAHELALAVGDDVDLLPALFGLMTFYLARGRPRDALDLAERRIVLARGFGDGDQLRETLVSAGFIRFYLGDLAGAGAFLDEADATPLSHSGAAPAVFFPEGSIARGRGVVHWLLGHDDVATRFADEAIRRSRAPEARYGLAAALGFGAVIATWGGRADRAATLADECVALAQREGYAFWIPFGSILRDYARAARATDTDALAAGLRAIESSIEAFARAGSALWRPFFLYLVADLYDRSGRPARAAAALEAALDSSGRTGEAFWDAAIIRRQAALYPDRARELLARALDVARGQGAVALERRVLADLEALSAPGAGD